MNVIMVLLAASVMVCVAVSRERSLLAGWIPTGTMLAAMTVLALPPLQPFSMLAVGALILAGLLAALGHNRLMAAHRGLSCISMAALGLMHHAMTDAPGAQQAHGTHEMHDSASFLTALVVGLVAGTVTIAIALIARHLRSTIPSERRDGAQMGEILLMTAVTAWMLTA